MNCQLRSLCVVALAGLMLMSARSADAQPVADLPRIEVVTPPERETPPAQPSSQPSAPGALPGGVASTSSGPQPPNQRTLIMDVRKGSGTEQVLFRELSDHLRRSGLSLVERTPSDSSQPCDNSICLEELARRENVGILLAAQVDENSTNSFVITMSLYDAVRRTPLQEKVECQQCNHALLTYKMNDTADLLISRCREARQNPPSVWPTPQPTSGPLLGAIATPAAPKAPPPAPGYFARLSPGRKILASVLGGLAGAALLTSIVLTVTDGKDTPLGCELRTDVLQDKCVLTNKAWYGPGYALTGALAVGIGFTLFWPQKKAAPVVAPGAPAKEVR